MPQGGGGQPSCSSLPCLAGSRKGREQAGDAEKTESFLTHQFYQETPSSAAGWYLHGLCG